ncbi:anaerobic sulfatase maturase [Candidatus Sumerlaeota bacterium]|nr:anaerobic sulfatase maturase [Candidatus Sumerlaeota bacterium]
MKSPSFSLLIKPASADCNLRCAYCFYLSKSSLYPETKIHRMSDDVLERLISSYMQTDQPQYNFGWQGGEPTLMGVDFFRKIIQLQKRLGKPGSIVANGLQTNAVLIDDKFAEYLARYKFLVGVSIDGPEEFHDTFRKTPDGKGSHQKVLSGIACMKRRNVPLNALVVVNSLNVHYPKETFDYLCDLGFEYHQYIPCVEFDPEGNMRPWAINGEQWGTFLCALFDEWYDKINKGVSIRFFDSILEYLVLGNKNICSMRETCDAYFMVEYNGDVYPCDFFAEPEWKLGNIMETSWENLLQSSKRLEFANLKKQVNPACKTRPWFEFCAGDCLKRRFYGNTNPQNISWLCAGWKMFYNHALPKLQKLAEKIKSRNQKARSSPSEKPGPNSPCPCGSGLKYKHCCGKPSNRRKP